MQRLKDAPWLHRPETQRVFALLDDGQGRIKAVGGIVRDTLLERQRDDGEIDFATELLPDEVMRLAGEAGIPAYPTGIAHGTVTLRIGDLAAEITTLREDVETDGRHAVVRFGRDWQRDAERRDFTLNALYVDAGGTLFDPIGGVDDCLAGVVRFIGDADRRLAEDRLRAYRFFRFSASHGGEVFDEAGLAAVTRVADELGELSAERVGHEMRRMFELAHVARTVQAMVDSGVLDLPRAASEWLSGYERRARRASLSGRLAVLSALVPAEELKARWRLSNDETNAAETVLAAARLLVDFHVNEAAYRYPAVLAEAVDVAATLAGWTEAGRAAVVLHVERTEVPNFPIDGNDLVTRGLRPGPGLGAELARLEKKWIESGFALDRTKLLDDVRR